MANIDIDITSRIGRREVDKELYKRYHLWRSRFIDVILCLLTIILLLNLYECTRTKGENTIKYNNYSKYLNSIQNISDIPNIPNIPLPENNYIYDHIRETITRICY